MKFFTRELYDKQHIIKNIFSRKANREWDDACKGYEKYLNSIKNSLPESMKNFCETTLHDAYIKSVSKIQDKLILEIDGSNCPWDRKGQFQLVFSGVKSIEGENEIIDDYWLYEEVHLSSIGKFEYHILLGKSEFRVIADEVNFIEVKK